MACRISRRNKYSIFDSVNNTDENEKLLVDFLKAYVSGSIEKKVMDSDETPSTSFNFAWENDNNYTDKYRGHSKNLEAAEQIAAETEILVIIGYSFPIFNREIDNKLFSKMKDLKKVYIQDRNPERIRSTIINAFEVLQETENEWSEEKLAYIPKQSVEILLEPYTDQFVIPYELNK